MKTKRFIQIALLLFVAVSVVYLVANGSRPSVAASSQPTAPAASPQTRPAKVVVYYFHGDFRCVSCRKLEAVSQQAVMDGFREELKRGELEWHAVNVEASENQHFISEYKLFSKSLVVVRFRNGQQTEYKTLAKAWELLRDDEALKKYVVSEVRSYLQAS